MFSAWTLLFLTKTLWLGFVVEILALLMLLLCLLLFHGLQQCLLLVRHNLKLVSSILLFVLLHLDFLLTECHFSFTFFFQKLYSITAIPSLPPVLRVSFIIFLGFPLLCLAHPFHCLFSHFFSSNFIILFLSIDILSVLVSSFFSLCDLFQENIQLILFRRYSRCTYFFPFFFFVPSLKKEKSLPDCAL